jgi:adenylate cyclase
MIASGVPVPNTDHAKVLCELGLDILKNIEEAPARHGRKIEIRIGINSGSLVAGIIGKSKYQFDLWGDTVNIASRMEAHGETGKLHISNQTYELVKNEFKCIHRGNINIKGKGEMKTWFIEENLQ